jgi:hypothetical protein
MVVLVDETTAGMNRKLELWRQTPESKGFRLSRTKTEYMRCSFSGEDGDVRLEGQIVPKRDTFRYLGSMFQSNRTTVGPAMLYGAECWPTKRQHIQQMSVGEMRMLRWMCGHIRKDRIRNEVIRDKLGVTPIDKKLVQHRLRWLGHIQRWPP